MPHPQCTFCPAPATCVVDSTAAGRVLARSPLCDSCRTARGIPDSAVVVTPSDLPAIASTGLCWCDSAWLHDVTLVWCPRHGRMRR